MPAAFRALFEPSFSHLLKFIAYAAYKKRRALVIHQAHA
jgi:hypothetical protein